jgi:hypothetical protein
MAMKGSCSSKLSAILSIGIMADKVDLPGYGEKKVCLQSFVLRASTRPTRSMRVTIPTGQGQLLAEGLLNQGVGEMVPTARSCSSLMSPLKAFSSLKSNSLPITQWHQDRSGGPLLNRQHLFGSLAGQV